MKLSIKIFLITFGLSLIAFLTFKILNEINRKNLINVKTQQLPDLAFLQLTGKQYLESKIRKNVIVNYFSPDCNHCQYMTEQISKNIDSFYSVMIIMVTSADSASTNRFCNDYHLDKFKNIVVLRDIKNQFHNYFGTVTSPTFFIYNDGILAKKIIGETKIENIIHAIHQPTAP